MIRNNQNGRRRGRGGVRPPQAGGGPSGNYGSNNRVDVRQRGNATQLLEKYKAMARDATQNGDRVQAEFYMQYADHYYRVLNEFRARDPQPAPRQNYDDDDGYENSTVGQNYAPPQPGNYADDGDDDEGDDDTARREPQANERGGYDRPNGERQGGDRQNAERPNSDRQAYDRNRGNSDASRTPQRGYNGQRDNTQRDNTQRDNTQRDNTQRDNTQRDNTQRDNGQRDNGQRDGGQRENVHRDVGQRDNGQREAAARSNGTRDVEQPTYRDDANAMTDGRAERPARTTEPVRRQSTDAARDASRESFAEFTSAPLLAGLPGPATLAAATPVSASGDGEAPPAPRRRGRPRKIVPTSEDAVDG